MDASPTALRHTLYVLSALAWREGWCTENIAIAARVRRPPGGPLDGRRHMGVQPWRIHQLPLCDARIAAMGDFLPAGTPHQGWDDGKPYLALVRAALVLEGHTYVPSIDAHSGTILQIPTAPPSAHALLADTAAVEARLRAIGWAPGMDVSDFDLLWKADGVVVKALP